MSEWTVQLQIIGPITVKSQITIDVEKGFEDPFLTTVMINAIPFGIKVELTARANDQAEAHDAAVFFIGQMIDVLSFKLNLPLFINTSGSEVIKRNTDKVRRIINRAELLESFSLSREYALTRGVLIRALGWYRKGLISEDPIDKFLAFWCALEGFGSESARRTERTAQGSVNQICDCFDQVWGECATWKVIQNDSNLVRIFSEMRNGISHGFIPVTIETIRKINSHLNVIKQLSFEFLNDWQIRGPINMG